MKNLMSEELLKQLLSKMASLETRVKFLESCNTIGPSYWENGTTQLSGGYQPFESDLPVRMPPKER